MYSIERDYTLESARRLPLLADEHPCSRLHGHSFGVRLVIEGPLDPRFGWVVDYGDVDEAFQVVQRELDHRYLNEVEGLENPTSEVLAKWIYDRVKRELPGLREVAVSEEGTARCRYRP